MNSIRAVRPLQPTGCTLQRAIVAVWAQESAARRNICARRYASDIWVNRYR